VLEHDYLQERVPSSERLESLNNLGSQLVQLSAPWLHVKQPNSPAPAFVLLQ
jgi:hypothetical protein